MVERTVSLEGIGLLNPSLENYNFTANNADNLIYTPSSNGEYTEGLAQIKIDAEGGNAPLWKSVSYYLNRQDVTNSDNPYVPFEFYTELWGVTDAGQLGFIGEDIVTTCPTTLTSEKRGFDLIRSACHSKFSTSSATGTSGKITLNLPFRTDYIEDMTLHVGNYNGWKRYKLIQIKGMSAVVTNQITNQVLIHYDSDMNSDFSDLRFLDWNGTELDYYIMHKVNGSKALILLKLPSSPALNEIKYVKMYYKKSDAVSPVNPRNVFDYLDDYEDGKYTGRSSPYQNWVCAYGTASIISSGQISGTYSLKHTGPGGTYGGYYPGMEISNSLTRYIVDFDFKLAAQGSLASTPYITLWYLRISSGGNVGQYLRVDTYWSGSAQILRLTKREGTTDTTIATATLKSSKMAVGDTYHFTILDRGDYCNVVVNGNSLISTQYTSTLPQTIKGYGAQQDSQGTWDNINIGAWVYVLFEGEGTEKQGEYGGAWNYTSISPDTLTAGSQEILFTSPTMDLNAQSYITYKEYGNTILTGNKFRINNGGVIKQGYNGLDAYKSLILRFNAKCNSNYNISIDDVKAQYEI